MGHPMLPDALLVFSSGLSWTLSLAWAQTPGLATPNIVIMGHLVPKTRFMGRRRHSMDRCWYSFSMPLLRCNTSTPDPSFVLAMLPRFLNRATSPSAHHYPPS